MPWLPMYLNDQDVQLLSSWLNSEEDIAIIEAQSPGEWKAVPEFSIRSGGRYCLFHTKSGPLPLLASNTGENDTIIPDPFGGWKELRTGANPNLPYFGAGHPAIFWLNLRTDASNEIGLSSFEWIGGHYASIGSPAPDNAKKWWERLRRWVKKNANRIPRSGPIEGNNPEIWAFHSALEAIRSGEHRSNNP